MRLLSKKIFHAKTLRLIQRAQRYLSDFAFLSVAPLREIKKPPENQEANFYPLSINY